MTPEVRQTLRHAGGLLLLRMLATAGGLLTIVFIPRLMGPTIYGEFSLLETLALWFSLLSGWGRRR